MSRTADKSFLSDKRIHLLINIFQYFYLFSTVLLILIFLLMAYLGRLRIEVLPSAIVTGVISYGIYHRKPWVSIVITFFAAYGIIGNLQSIRAGILTSLIFITILVLEIYFFNTKAVKAKFGSKHYAVFF